MALVRFSILLLLVFTLKTMTISANSNTGYDQISMNKIQLGGPRTVFVFGKIFGSAGMSADQNNIYTKIDLGKYYNTYGFDYSKNYALTIGNQQINFNMVGTAPNNFLVVAQNSQKKMVTIGEGSFTNYNTSDTAWVFNISIAALKQNFLKNDIPENTQISVANSWLFKGAVSINYSGASTGPWLLALIGLIIAGSGYYFTQYRKHRRDTAPFNEMIHA